MKSAYRRRTTQTQTSPGASNYLDRGEIRLLGILRVPESGRASGWNIVGETYLERVKYTPDVDALSALCEIFLSETEDTVVELTATAREGEIFLGSQKLLCRHGYGKAVLVFPDYDVRREELLWTPDHPNLIDVRVRVFCRDGESDGKNGEQRISDEVATYSECGASDTATDRFCSTEACSISG